MQEINNYPLKDCETNQDIAECRFTLSVMSDDYITMILNAIGNVDTENIRSNTDALSTVYCGKRIHVVDAVKACFVHVNDGKTHITMEAAFSKGGSGDTDENIHLIKDVELLNSTNKAFQVLSKISFYPLGITTYMNHITYVVNLAISKGLYKKSSHYTTELAGDVNEIFDYFNEILDYAERHLKHYVLQTTLSINSPTKNKEESS